MVNFFETTFSGICVNAFDKSSFVNEPQIPIFTYMSFVLEIQHWYNFDTLFTFKLKGSYMHTGFLLLDTELLEQPNLNTELVQLYNLLLVFLAQLLLYLLMQNETCLAL